MSKKIVVTGGAGFIGCHIVEELISQKDKEGKPIWEVTVVDDLSNPKSRVPESVRFLKLDLTIPKNAEEALIDQEYVIHTAAKIGGIGYFHQFPQMMINDNCLINATIINAAIKVKSLKRFVYLSSSMVHEGSDEYPHKESHIGSILPPKTAYGQSKLIGEWMLKAAYKQNKMEYAIAVPFNAYGPGETPKITNGELEVGSSHVIPDLFFKIYQSKDGSVKILGDGTQTRCFTYVTDLAKGVVTLVTHPKAKNETFNLGDTTETNIKELVLMIWKIMGKEGKPKIITTKSFKHDVQRRVPSVEKAKNLLGFETSINLSEGLEKVWRWFQKDIINNKENS